MLKYSPAVIVLFLSIQLILGCQVIENIPETPVQTSEWRDERYTHFFKEEDYLRAIALIIRKHPRNFKENKEYGLALDGLKEQWEQAIRDNDWRRCIAFLRSFNILEESQIIGEYREIDFFMQGFYHYIEDKKYGAAITLFQENIDMTKIADQDRLKLEAALEKIGYDIERQNSKADISDLINGTVTIWVDKGTRLKGNVSLPDREIGSGFFIDNQGYIITNYHVIESEVNPEYRGYSRLFIKGDEISKKRVPAKVVGYDKNFDIALLKTEMQVPYSFVFAGKSDVPKLGDRISAIGSPGGLMKTLTSGTVSAYARTLQPMSGSLQIDVPVNPGNSGGPLLNENGQVIGVVFAGITDFEGINFAIPGFYVKRLIPSLYDGGKMKSPWLGVSAWDNSGQIVLTYVVPDSPAYDIGLRTGDVIEGINGQKFKTIRSIQDYLITIWPHTMAMVKWQRDGIGHQAPAALAVRPDIPLKEALKSDARVNLLQSLFGFTVRRISGRGFLQNYTVLTVLPGSIADESGFVEGDTISMKRWQYIEDQEAIVLLLVLKGRKSGFIESALQIGTLLNVATVF